MKYRLKHDHSKTLEAVPTPKHIPPWVRVDFYDAQYHCFAFDVPAAFLEVSGWEPVPEKEPSIEEKLDEWAKDYDDISFTRHLMASAAAEIRRLKTECHIRAVDEANARMAERTVDEACAARDAAQKLVAELEMKVADVTAQRDAAANDRDELWKKWVDAIRCNAELGTALVEKMTEGK